MDQNQPFGSAQDKPFGSAQDKPFGSAQDKPFGSAQGGQVPPPPQTPEIKLRTMESDVSSIEKTGGAAPAPEFVAPPSGGPIFKEEKTGMSAGVKAVIWIIIVLAALGLAAGASYYLWPIWRGTTVVEPPPLEIPKPTPSPVGGPVPASPLTPVHVSHFGFPNEIIPRITVSDYSIIAILTALQNEANNAGGAGELREIFLVDSGGQPISFSRFMAILMPELLANNLKNTLQNVFEDDFTAYLYFDDKGAWPGYSVKMKENIYFDIVTLQGHLKELETASFGNFFLTPPGVAQEFRAGTVKNSYTNRFAPLSQPGSSFNYGLFNDRLIINTSYGGLLEALELMGL